MLITLQELELHPISVSKAYPPGALEYRGTDFHQQGPLKADITARLSGLDIHIAGHISGLLESNCDRCLVRVEVPVEPDFDLVYRPLSRIVQEEEIEIPEDELKVGFYSGDGIELDDVVKEQVILAIPMKVVCRPECQGLCPVCGANRNTEHCPCSSGLGDSPFAFLKEQ